MVFVNSFHQDPRNNKNPPDSPGKKNISPRFEPKPADAHIVRGPPSLCRSLAKPKPFSGRRAHLFGPGGVRVVAAGAGADDVIKQFQRDLRRSHLLPGL